MAQTGRSRSRSGCIGGSNAALAGKTENQRPAGDVVPVVDAFTKGFRPEVAGAAARVLADAEESASCSADASCGSTWISTGQLDTTTKLLGKAAQLRRRHGPADRRHRAQLRCGPAQTSDSLRVHSGRADLTLA